MFITATTKIPEGVLIYICLIAIDLKESLGLGPDNAPPPTTNSQEYPLDLQVNN